MEVMKRLWLIFGAGVLSLAVVGQLRAAELTSQESVPAESAASGTLTGPKPGTPGAEQVAYINELIRQGWQAQGLQPSQPATEGEWCRRVYLDVLGRIPSVDELDRFSHDHTPQKKLNLINRLLSDEYVEDYARNWSN